MTIRVSVEQITINGTIGLAFGTDVDTQKPITFGGDWRPLVDISEALANGEDVIVDVEPWQVLGNVTLINVP